MGNMLDDLTGNHQVEAGIGERKPAGDVACHAVPLSMGRRGNHVHTHQFRFAGESSREDVEEHTFATTQVQYPRGTLSDNQIGQRCQSSVQ